MFDKKVADISQHQAIKALLEMQNGSMSREEFEEKHSVYIGEVPECDENRSGC
ncbi:hypothetical protein [Laceyella sacchari]|uniref:Antitoxin VbhA domain-containing protein n=1 Tax=Laceyella sacchari TaxID=37482 RepID=A0ABY5U5G1_LACSH|nr:hypothetical protein [Laceyella sacchari]UWE04882.1 hypothetical protein NYR52_07115 [Laceyella sacchari]